MQEVNHQLFSDSVKNECLLANEDASEQEIRELLEEFDLKEYAEYHPMILSGGQRQRLAVCQAVMSGKKMLIFDEPTLSLIHIWLSPAEYRFRKETYDGK